MLFLVATPIGNLEDITLRALKTLRKVDLIACEDTRKTSILLKRYKIKKPLISFHEYNEKTSIKKIIRILEKGQSVALVANSGTPAISDPGFTLVREAIKLEIEITIIPGPTAFVMALILSGLPVHSFTFRGFPPHKAGKRRKFMEMDKNSSHTVIYYESPHRLIKFLKDAIEIFGDREAAIANELTKMFETIVRGKLSELLDKMEKTKIEGEYTVVITGSRDKNGK